MENGRKNVLDVSPRKKWQVAKAGARDSGRSVCLDDSRHDGIPVFNQRCFVRILSNDRTQYQRGHPHLCLALG